MSRGGRQRAGARVGGTGLGGGPGREAAAAEPPRGAGCLFCRIAAGEVAAPVVHEDAGAIVFLDHRPLFPGHCLVVPRAHVETLEDVPAPDVGPLFALVRRVASAVEGALAAEGSFVAVNNRVSQSVPHLHVHVVPRRRKDGLRGFFWPRQKYASDAEAQAIAAAIRAALG